MPSPRMIAAPLLAVFLIPTLFCRPGLAQSAPGVCFDETGFCITEPAILEFFQTHAAQNGLGFPVSRGFRLHGSTLQLFQRIGVRLAADGRAEALDILGDEILPLRRIDGSPLPPPDLDLISRAPQPIGPNFEQRADEFLRAEIPDIFEGQPMGFLTIYLGAAGADRQNPSSALALFGWPTSRPFRDVSNGNAVYQRFERAIFQYDPTRGASQPLLLGDYVKGVLTGLGLPHDLAADARGSPLLGQYNPYAIDGLHRPWELAGSDLADAFRLDLEQPSRRLTPDGFGAGSGWPEPDGMATPLADGYAVSVNQTATSERAASAAVSNLQSLADFALVVDARLATPVPAGYALHLRRQSDEERFTLLVDAQRRLASFYRRSAGLTTMLWGWAPVAELRESTENNRYTIRAVRSRFTVWVNGALMLDLESAGPREGSLWLAAVTWDEPATTVFSNLRVSAPE